jgi:hypothetical protein
LFSNPSFFSFEKGRLLGSAQTFSSLRSTTSLVCAAAGPAAIRSRLATWNERPTLI